LITFSYNFNTQQLFAHLWTRLENVLVNVTWKEGGVRVFYEVRLQQLLPVNGNESIFRFRRNEKCKRSVKSGKKE